MSTLLHPPTEVLALQHVLENVLNIPTNSDVHSGFKLFWINTIHDLMNLKPNEDLQMAYIHPTTDEKGDTIERKCRIPSMLIRNIDYLQQWYRASDDPNDVRIWFKLQEPEFNSWKHRLFHDASAVLESDEAVVDPSVLMSSLLPASTSQSEATMFLRSIKRSPSDYNKFKDDSRWKQWNRHLKATANSHGLGHVLTPSYVPLDDAAQELFNHQNTFMYSVFESCLQTSKSRHIVQTYEKDANAQHVYIALLSVYEEDLSTSLLATDLRSELTLLRFDDTWKKNSEAFLLHWTSKILQLEQLEDKSVDDDTKRLWLTATLSTKLHMATCLTQAKVTEMTLLGMNSSGSKQMPWESFYNLILAHAKLYDHSHATTTKTKRDAHLHEQGGRGRGRGRGGGGGGGRGNPFPGRGYSGAPRTPRPDLVYTTVTGPNMVMKANMIFKSDEWNKLSAAQKSQLRVAKNIPPKPSPSPNPPPTQINATDIQPNPIPTVPNPSVPTPTDSHLRQVLSNRTVRTTNADNNQVTFNGQTYQRITNTVNVSYQMHNAARHSHQGSLIDGGANGGMSGSDVRILEQTLHHADVSGLAEHAVTDLPIVTAAGVIISSQGPIIGIFHQYAHFGSGKTIHSINQMRRFGIDICDIPRTLHGKQRIHHPDGYVIPLSIRNGLPYMDMHPPTDLELDKYPHVFFTSDATWDPSTLDHEFTVEDLEIVDEDHTPIFGQFEINNYGEFRARECATHITCSSISGNDDEDFEDYIEDTILKVHLHKVSPVQHDFNRLSPNFGFVPTKRIQKTIEHTTQFCRLDARLPLRKHFKSRFPAANVPRRNEIVATDTFFSDVPAHDDGILGHGGAEMVQLYCGTTSLITAIFPMKTESEMPGTLLDFIRKLGAPNGLFSDNAKVQIGKTVQSILRMYCIDDMQSEPHHQHQNPAERRIQDVKKVSNQIMDRTGTPASFWLLSLLHTTYILNRLSTESLDWLTPYEKAFGQKPDISAILAFRWWEPVYYAIPGATYPNTKECLARIVGIADHQGDAMTWLLLDDITKKVVCRSAVRTAIDPSTPNLRAEHPIIDGTLSSDAGEIHKPILSVSDLTGHVDTSSLKLPKFSPEELTGLTFTRELDDGKTYRAKIVQKILDNDAANHEKIKFLVRIGDGEFDEIISYNELSNIVEEQHERQADSPDTAWSYKGIKSHHGPITSAHKDYKGSSYNVLVEWEDGSETYEPLDIIIKDDPVSVATYASENNLLDTPGWKRLKHIANGRQRLTRMIQQTKVNRPQKGKVYNFGILVPRNVKQAFELDKANGNTLWQDAMTKEIENIQAYKTFKDMGKVNFVDGYKKIIVHFVFAVKHDLRHKARLVAGGHLTEPTMEGSYSSVVSLRSLRICLVAAELNGLKTMVGDISSAYLEAYTKERVCFTAGPEFGILEGHTFVIEKALYGLRTSGASWHQRFSDTLRDLKFKPCLADNDVWIKDCLTHYEYVCVYVDDIMHMSTNPQLLFDSLKEKYGYNLAGVGEPSYHLGGNFDRDDDGTLAWGAQAYIKKMLSNYSQLFGTLPKEYSSPMEEGDHPELDLTAELDQDGIRLYQSLIGALQWAVTLGRFDILVGVTTMSSFRVAPRQGHLERLQRMYGYLKRQPDGAIRFRTGIPDHESRGTPVSYNWINSVYGPNEEELPDNMPPPRGQPFRTTTYEDANLMHCLVTGRSMSGIIHLVNQTPVQWFCKKQNVVETATYGSEFMVARQATEQIMDLRYTLRMMGIPIDGPAWMFGDNQSVITSSNIPHSNLNKRHNALSYHRVREAISAKILYFIHIDGKLNPSDILTKFLSWAKFWPLIQPMLFWKGETMKDNHPNLPITQVIEQTKAGSPSGLRGVTSTSRVSPSGAADETSGTQLVHAENLVANGPVVQKLHTKQNCGKQRDKPLTAPRHKDIIHTVLDVPVTSLLTSDESVSCVKDPDPTNGVESHKGTVDSYTDGTWQIVKSKKSHR